MGFIYVCFLFVYFGGFRVWAWFCGLGVDFRWVWYMIWLGFVGFGRGPWCLGGIWAWALVLVGIMRLARVLGQGYVLK